MIITSDTIVYMVMIFFALIVTHAIAYLEGWLRGRAKLRKELRAFISREEIDKAVDEIIKEREE